MASNGTTVAPWRAWRRVITRSVADLFANDGLTWAASLAFYTLLSAFPLVIAIIIVASYVTDPAWVAERIIDAVNEFVPSESLDPQAILDSAVRERDRLGIVAAAIVLVSGRRVLGTLVVAFDRMSDVDQADDPIRRRSLLELALVGGLVVLAAIAVSTRPALAFVERAVGLTPASAEVIGRIATELSQTVLIFLALTLVYAVVPLGTRLWRAVLIAAAVTTALFLATRAAVTAVVTLIWSAIETIYGPLALAVFLLTWVYWVAVVVLFGASLSSHIKVMLIEGASVAETRRRHVPRTSPPPIEGEAAAPSD